MKYKFILLLLLISAVLSGCQNYNVVEKDSNNYPSISPLPKASQVEITLYFPDANERYLSKEERIVNVENENLENVVIRELLKGTELKNLKSFFPQGTELLSVITKNGIAYISFSKNLISQNDNEKEEALLLYSIVNSLTALEDIEAVQILIQGEIKEIFNKYYSISEPLKFSELIIGYDYTSPIETVEEYYESILNKQYSKLNSVVYYERHKGINFSIFKSYFEFKYEDFSNYEINKYIIDSYDKDTKIVLDMTIYHTRKVTNIQKDKELYLKYHNGRFRIQSGLENTE